MRGDSPALSCLKDEGQLMSREKFAMQMCVCFFGGGPTGMDLWTCRWASGNEGFTTDVLPLALSPGD